MTDPRRGHVDTTERRVQVYEHPYCCVSSSVFGDCSSKKRVLNRFVFQNNVTAFTTNPPVSASPGNEVCAVRKNKGRFAVEQLLLCLRFLCEPQSYVPYVQQHSRMILFLRFSLLAYPSKERTLDRFVFVSNNSEVLDRKRQIARFWKLGLWF